jgi:hypothetical protein
VNWHTVNETLETRENASSIETGERWQKTEANNKVTAILMEEFFS